MWEDNFLVLLDQGTRLGLEDNLAAVAVDNLVGHWESLAGTAAAVGNYFDSTVAAVEASFAVVVARTFVGFLVDNLGTGQGRPSHQEPLGTLAFSPCFGLGNCRIHRRVVGPLAEVPLRQD